MRLAGSASSEAENHFLHDGKAVLLEEHMLGTTKADPLRAEFNRLLRVTWGYRRWHGP